jgi:DNA-binding HxlR family transcriptional regulator/putative sterol carrier protein
MAGRRKYDDGCAVAHGLDLIGERWALLVVRELLLGPKRFTDLRAGMPGASPDVLAQRLRELQDAGVVQHRKLAPPAGSWVYELTRWGAELEPIVTQLARWSSRSRSMRRDAPIGVDSLLLSLKALFEPRAAEGLSATIALRLGDSEFHVQITDGRLEVARGQAAQPDATLDTDPGTLTALLRNDRQPADALRAGDLRLDGDRAAAERFLGLFPLPEPV